MSAGWSLPTLGPGGSSAGSPGPQPWFDSFHPPHSSRPVMGTSCRSYFHAASHIISIRASRLLWPVVLSLPWLAESAYGHLGVGAPWSPPGGCVGSLPTPRLRVAEHRSHKVTRQTACHQSNRRFIGTGLISAGILCDNPGRHPGNLAGC